MSCLSAVFHSFDSTLERINLIWTSISVLGKKNSEKAFFNWSYETITRQWLNWFLYFNTYGGKTIIKKFSTIFFIFFQNTWIIFQICLAVDGSRLLSFYNCLETVKFFRSFLSIHRIFGEMLPSNFMTSSPGTNFFVQNSFVYDQLFSWESNCCLWLEMLGWPDAPVGLARFRHRVSWSCLIGRCYFRFLDF